LSCDKDFACFVFTFCDNLLSVSEETDYKRTLETATAELSDLIEEAEELDDRREKVERRIAALRNMVLATSHVLGEDPQLTYPELFPETIEPEIGFTDAVREVLKSSNKYLSPVDIRNTLRDRGFNLEKYRNPLAAIHQILKRLVENSKEVERHPDENRKLFKWKQVTGTPWLPQHPGTSRSYMLEQAMRMAQESLQEAKAIVNGPKVPEVPGADSPLVKRMQQKFAEQAKKDKG
jgi:hypothetical protein